MARSIVRHVFGGSTGLIPHPPRDEHKIRLPGMRHGSKHLTFCCRILGQDIWFVDGERLRRLDAGFDGLALHTVANYVPKREIWIDRRIPGWAGFVAARGVLVAMLMQVRSWPQHRAERAGDAIENWLREVAVARGVNDLQAELPLIWATMIDEYMPGLDREQVDDMSRQAARQLWKYL